MRTEADNKLDSAKNHIAIAAKELFGIIMNDYTGSDEFNDEYKTKMRNALAQLMTISENLK